MPNTTPASIDTPVEIEPISSPAIAPLTSAGPTILHSGMSTRRFYAMHVMGATFPLTAAFALYGWRALIVMAAVVGSAAGALFVWRRIGGRGVQLRYSHGLYLALLLALTLPAHLASGRYTIDTTEFAVWAILPAAGIALVMLIWLLGGLGSGRVHPVLLTHLLLVGLFEPILVPHWILQRDDLFVGDALDAPAVEQVERSKQPWVQMPVDEREGIYMEPASARLAPFTRGKVSPDRTSLSLVDLLLDRMPPLEDLIFAGHAGPIGTSSAIAIIIGGLFLLYRGLIDFRIPLLIFLFAFLTLLILPVPVVTTADAAQWRWMIIRHGGVGLAVATTFIHYEIMAGPMLFMAFFLATAPAVRPMARRARVIYAVLAGILTAVIQLYLNVSHGPYLALLIVSLLTPTFDKWFRPRPLV